MDMKVEKIVGDSIDSGFITFYHSHYNNAWRYVLSKVVISNFNTMKFINMATMAANIDGRNIYEFDINWFPFAPLSVPLGKDRT